MEALGYQTLIEPLLTIGPEDPGPLDLDGVQAVVLTSAHAVPALSEPAKALPVYAVGEATAKAAAAAGCRNVIAGSGSALDLARLVGEKSRPQGGAILHLAGEVVREGLAESLRAGGFEVERRLAYRALPAERLSDDLVTAWRRRQIGAVLLFSPRTAEILVRLLSRHGLERHVDTTAAICLSADTAAPCAGLQWKAVRAADAPDRQSLLRALVGSTAIC